MTIQKGRNPSESNAKGNSKGLSLKELRVKEFLKNQHYQQIKSYFNVHHCALQISILKSYFYLFLIF